MRSVPPLRRAVLVAHAALLVATAVGVARLAIAPAARGLLLAAALAPLAAAWPGLYRGRLYTYQWTALILVLFAGAAVVEVVASLGTSAVATLVLLAALVELALLFLLSRRVH